MTLVGLRLYLLVGHVSLALVCLFFLYSTTICISYDREVQPTPDCDPKVNVSIKQYNPKDDIRDPHSNVESDPDADTHNAVGIERDTNPITRSSVGIVLWCS